MGDGAAVSVPSVFGSDEWRLIMTRRTNWMRKDGCGGDGGDGEEEEEWRRERKKEWKGRRGKGMGGGEEEMEMNKIVRRNMRSRKWIKEDMKSARRRVRGSDGRRVDASNQYSPHYKTSALTNREPRCPSILA